MLARLLRFVPSSFPLSFSSLFLLFVCSHQDSLSPWNQTDSERESDDEEDIDDHDAIGEAEEKEMQKSQHNPTAVQREEKGDDDDEADSCAPVLGLDEFLAQAEAEAVDKEEQEIKHREQAIAAAHFAQEGVSS